MDLVTFGEAMLRLTPPEFGRLEQATNLELYVGGSELNVAVLAARLGVRSRWVSRLPDNALGHMIATRAREQGVEPLVEWTQDGRAGLYFVELDATAPRARNVLYDRKGSAISQVMPGSLDWSSALAGARWYHVSGITPALSDSAATVTAESLVAAKRNELTVSYDLNYRSQLWTPEQARAAQEPLMEHVDVLIATEADARLVFGAGSAQALQRRFEIGAVVFTLADEEHSAMLVADGTTHTAPRYDVAVVDRVGAGDAFMGGLIVSRLAQRSWEEAIRFGAATAALKHTIPGDFCLVTRDRVEEFMRGASVRASR